VILGLLKNFGLENIARVLAPRLWPEKEKEKEK
jgi:hypothetical protein